MSERPTPETDKAERMAFASEYMVPTEFARELERQRDEAYQKQNETYRSSKYACDYHHELKINAEKERDEAREKAERYRLEANAMMLQRDEAREALREMWQSGDAFLPYIDNETTNRWRKAAGWEETK